VSGLANQDLEDALSRDDTKFITFVSQKNADGDVGVALPTSQRVIFLHEVSGLTHEDLEDALRRDDKKLITYVSRKDAD
jgi:hypothetical protein